QTGATQTGATPQGARPAPEQPAAATRPMLVVHITVDQLRADYHDRWASQLDGGLARLYRGGAVFMNAYQDHAIAETAPGHASTLSGRFPRSTGITMNARGVADPRATIIGGGAMGASPFRFRGSALLDWMRIDDPRSRALSVSRKDRGAILPVGRLPEDVYWYVNDGRFSTSSYYGDTLPGWVQAFNARQIPQSYAGRAWTLLLPDSAYAEPDSVPSESGGRNFVFPHVVPPNGELAAGALPAFPWMDDLTADFALAGLEAMGLGRGPQTDLLAVSFSTTDAVGHQYGPDSRELHDQILRLDRVLGRFIDSLYKLRDSSSIIISLTSDHGVAPMPGTASHDPNRGAVVVSLRPLIAGADSALQRRGVPAGAVYLESGAVTVDRAALARAGVNADSVIDALAAGARAVRGVMRADRWEALSGMDTTRDDVARRWLHMFPPDMRPDLVVTLTPYSTWSASYFQHGAPHSYDTNVPVIFYGPPFRAARFTEFTRVVDIAPTLAAVLGVPPTEALDGRVLRQALVAPPAAAQASGRATPRRDD
ncbi:MAG TPA: alkaline phosphatase family protein, partial [Gemmatimonadaceae bacterium]|nr:alkaline phosphatase family protein [Gemmatimonadaceae bacterium]